MSVLAEEIIRDLDARQNILQLLLYMLEEGVRLHLQEKFFALTYGGG